MKVLLIFILAAVGMHHFLQAKDPVKVAEKAAQEAGWPDWFRPDTMSESEKEWARKELGRRVADLSEMIENPPIRT